MKSVTFFCQLVCYFVWIVVCLAKCGQNMSKNSLELGGTNSQWMKTSVKPFTLCLISETWQVQRFTFDKQKIYHFSGGDLACWRDMLSSKHTGWVKQKCSVGMYQTRPLWEDTVLCRVNSDQTLRKMKWKNAEHCLGFHRCNLSQRCPHMLCKPQKCALCLVA